ncbi:peptide chain release factor N(5)-glutamine methyltransferase [Echinicola jeungdonensis]|uniref:peptide chain release factor N(5)-glutamine methyltransferase n=1 Tax=Echinicola jeungdonensis TaxID=709343 RepID=A0ABV5J6K3_9BACT|nr:peptide chain release factor N(5)-glutamine methyltransferase [Echinicola jeungdonensis]MDN3669303.1 peptide chain release factor N(5)-glutamine methyltransferase [Echinicola jeungdonensis]
MIAIRKLYQDLLTRVQKKYPKPEAQQLVFWLLEHYLDISRADIIRDKSIGPYPEELEEGVKALEEGKPIQYIIGWAPFYGREFQVEPGVLIPRNETEELVHLIIRENPEKGLKILDIGTGSGCIPITLFLEMQQPVVHALDVSPDALKIARANAEDLQAQVEFHQKDILKDKIPLRNLDILVSNPPYVRELEKAWMHSNVLEHEPGLALFVSDDDPLVFYKTIAQKGLKSLKPKGKLYFEINEALGKELEKLLEQLKYQNIRLHQDLKGKDRIISAIRN